MLKKLINNQNSDFLKTSFGNILEWYDFTIYGLFAIGISKTFFYGDNKFISLLLVFATFAIGFVARPVGSVIFGMIGDRYGKHYAVNLSIWLMALPTVLIGLLPGYQQIGWLAPTLLVMLRICQGLSAGGQFSGLVTIAVDSSHTQRNFLVSLVYTISVVGCFAASLVGYLSVVSVNYFEPTSEFAKSLTWRIPFIFSAVLFLIYVKLNPEFHKHTPTTKQLTFSEVFKRQPGELITMSLIGVCLSTIYYVLFTYLVTFLQLYMHLTKQSSFLIMNGLLLLSIVLYPCFGLLADKSTHRIKTAQRMVHLLIAGVLVFTAGYYNVWLAIAGLVVTVVAFCAIASHTTPLFAEMFEKPYRMTACSLSYNLGITIAGFSPLIAEIMSKSSTFGLSTLMLLTATLLLCCLRLVNRHPSAALAPMLEPRENEESRVLA